MAVHYHVPAGKTFAIAGPCNVTVKGGEYPAVVDDLADAQASAPTIDALDPATAASGDPDLTMTVTGSNFTPETVIVFGEHAEPTTLSEDGSSVSTGVKPELFAPATVPVKVRNGPLGSNSLDFTFTAPAGARGGKKTDALA